MPTIVLAELYAGAYLLDQPDRVLLGISELRIDVGLLGFDEPCAEEFGKLRGRPRRLGIARNPVDLMIATVALVCDLLNNPPTCPAAAPFIDVQVRRDPHVPADAGTAHFDETVSNNPWV
jgi:hypothetical protein